MAEKSKRGPGRPRKPVQPGREVASLGLRVPAVLKEWIDRSADASGRSQGEEAAYRLTMSFKVEGLFDMIRMAERATGKSWEKDKETAEIAFDLLAAYFRRTGPEGFEGREMSVFEQSARDAIADEFVIKYENARRQEND